MSRTQKPAYIKVAASLLGESRIKVSIVTSTFAVKATSFPKGCLLISGSLILHTHFNSPLLMFSLSRALLRAESLLSTAVLVVALVVILSRELRALEKLQCFSSCFCCCGFQWLGCVCGNARALEQG